MNVGDKVCLKSNPNKIGFLQRKLTTNTNRILWNVKFDTDITQYPESYLALYEEDNNIYDLPTLISKNMFNSVADVRRELTKIRLNGNLNDIIYSMGTTNTDFYAHQFKPVMKIINSASNSVLIADEVGLGKTIEAGLIWTELKQRYNFRKLLVICPGVLRQKWQDELRKKMGVKAEIVNAKELLQKIATEDEFALICSRQGLVSRNKDDRRNKEDNDVRDKGNIIRQTFDDYADKGEKLIDLLIVDEAHYLRNPETQIYKIAKSLREISEYVAFLSATPIQNKSNDLLTLVSLLDPINFNREYVKNSFDEILEINRPLIKLRDGLLADKLNKDEILNLIHEVHVLDLLGLFNNSKQLSTIYNEISQDDFPSKERLHHFAYEMDSINSLGYIINRTRKRDIQENRVIRDPIPEEIKMTPEENQIFDKISEKVKEYALTKGNEGFSKFLLCMPQRMMSSCIYATLDMWKKRISNTYYDDGDREDTDVEITDFMNEIYSEVAKIKNMKILYDNDTKYERLLSVLKTNENNYPGEKIVLFSSFISTLEYLQKRLQNDGIESVLISGKIKDKDALLEEFENNKNKKILLASEVGSEGVDLQFCRLLINYDLPWNPMRIEQRIGRIDRIGQKHDKIVIWNMFHDTTIDKRIYTKLYDKFEICTSALGDFELILGNMFKELSVSLLTLTPEEQDKKIEQTISAIQNQKTENNKLEEAASQLTAYGDYVLQEIQKAKDSENTITASDIANYVTDTLVKIYKNTDIRRTNIENKFEICVDSNFRVDFEDYCKNHSINTGSLLLKDYGNIPCIFTSNVVIKSQKGAEIINQFHPIIRFLRMKDKKLNASPVSAIKLDNDKNQGLYLIGVSLMSAKGITAYEKLIYNGINLETNEKLTEDFAKKITIDALNNGRVWVERSGLDYDKLGKIADDVMLMNLDIYENMIRDIENKNFDKIEMQKVTLNRHLDLKREQLKETIQKHILSGNERMIPATEGKFVILEQKIKDRLLKIENNKEINPQKRDICMLLVKVM